MKLSNANLNKLTDGIDVPGYDRTALTPGILHIGVGNFHRAHQAIYLHRLFETGRDHDWAIIGAGVKPYDEAMRQRLAPQDWLTTVVELDPAGYSATICGSMIDFCAIDAGKLVAAMAQPEIRIVSLTVTEGGYYVDAKTGGFDAAHPDIIADAEDPEHPTTVFGQIIAALMARRAAGIAPFTVMSCDNLPENGHVARNAVIGLAERRSDDAAEWISANVAFPCGMVDCITPATGPREIGIVAEKFGIEDAAPVVCEPFRQWVLEDNFSMGRPALETVGVQFVADVAPYELMKLRILNGGHAIIAYPAGLMGITYVHEAMENSLVAGFLDKLEREEIMPTVPSIEGVSTESYFRKCVERFSNPAVGDTIPRLCLDGSNRQPKFILPTIDARLSAGQPVDGLALESALWCRYCYGTTDAGAAIPPNDPNWERLTAQAKLAKDTPQQWLAMTDIYGDLGDRPAFAEAFAAALTALWQNGTEATLTTYINGG
ncbi:mannitol dehydrogenase family protein [uncultured Hoeflea sp.]|uniref:mannitol dehydrogenase family protein n=1 Tax=uncultured Hoeflea sp. TaxID=538666 RepID=UPI0030DD7C6A